MAAQIAQAPSTSSAAGFHARKVPKETHIIAAPEMQHSSTNAPISRLICATVISPEFSP